MSKTFDFTRLDLIHDWDSKQSYFQLGPTGLQMKRTETLDANILSGTTLVAAAGTTINNGTSATDWEKASVTTLQGTGVQEVTIDFGVGVTKYLKKMVIHRVQQTSAETFNAVQVYGSADGTNWFERPMEQSTTEPTIYMIDVADGTLVRHLKIKGAGTSLSADVLHLRECMAYEAGFKQPFVTIDHSLALWTNNLTGVVATPTLPASTLLNIQLLKNDLPYYWDGSTWVSAGSDLTRCDEFSNTIAIANTNAPTFLPGSGDKQKIGIRLVYIPTSLATPSITTVQLTSV